MICEHSLAVEPGHSVLIETLPEADPLCRAIALHVREAGGHAIVRMWPEGWTEGRVEEATSEVLAHEDRVRELLYRRVDRRVIIGAERNPRALAHLPGARVAAQATSHLRSVHELVARDAAGEARWLVAQYPTEGYAGESGLSLADYRDLMARALLLDEPDPVAAWRAVGERQQRIATFLDGVDELHVTGPGTDLRMRVGGRRWVSAHGRHNLPDGEVFSAPHEDATAGVVTFALPVVWQGSGVVQDARLRFEGGRCVEAHAAVGDDVLQAALALDDGTRVLGEVAFGLNMGLELPTHSTLLDEKIGGTMHLALGNAYSVTGGTNKSRLHWDLVCDLRAGGEVRADGATVFRDGAFLPGVTE